jgi:hypothetical protein
VLGVLMLNFKVLSVVFVLFCPIFSFPFSIAKSDDNNEFKKKSEFIIQHALLCLTDTYFNYKIFKSIDNRIGDMSTNYLRNKLIKAYKTVLVEEGINNDVFDKMIAVDGLGPDLTVTKVLLSSVNSCFSENNDSSGRKTESKWEFISNSTLVFRMSTIDVLINRQSDLILVFEILPDKAIFTRLIYKGRESSMLERAYFFVNIIGPCAMISNSTSNDDNNNFNLNQINKFFDDCLIFFDIDFPGYRPEEFIEIALKIYTIEDNVPPIYILNTEDDSPADEYYI